MCFDISIATYSEGGSGNNGASHGENQRCAEDHGVCLDVFRFVVVLLEPSWLLFVNKSRP